MYRVVQLSDLHLTADEGRPHWGADVWGNLRRALADVREHAGQVDLLVLTGDVANERRPATYARLREWLEAHGGTVRLVPGNHDSRPMLRAAFADLAMPRAETVNFVVRAAGWKLIGLDSLQPWRVHGRLGAAQLAWLRDALADRQPAVLFVHHPPLRVGCWWLDKDLLRDRRELADVVAGCGVRALVCGHVHQVATGRFAGVEVWTCPSTAYQFRPRAWLPAARQPGAGYRVIEIDGERLTTRVRSVPVAGG